MNLIIVEDMWTSLCFTVKRHFQEDGKRSSGEFSHVVPAQQPAGQEYWVRSLEEGLLLCLSWEGCYHLLWVSKAGLPHCPSPS